MSSTRGPGRGPGRAAESAPDPAAGLPVDPLGDRPGLDPAAPATEGWSDPAAVAPGRQAKPDGGAGSALAGADGRAGTDPGAGSTASTPGAATRPAVPPGRRGDRSRVWAGDGLRPGEPGGGDTDVLAPVAPVRLAASGPRHALRAVKVVWQREMIRFVKDRGRLISGLAQPVLLLFVLGSGLSGLVRAGTGGLDFRTFLFTGIVATSTLFTAIFAGVSIVWDREFGFLREMLVAPVPRTAILIGKCLGGATVATAQSIILLALAGLVGVPYSPVMFAALIGLLFLTALSITAFGLMISARIKRFQAIMPIMQLVLTPMMFLSGSMFPLSRLPAWLTVLTRINPLTYAVEPMRHVVFDHLKLDPITRHTLDPG